MLAKELVSSNSYPFTFYLETDLVFFQVRSRKYEEQRLISPTYSLDSKKLVTTIDPVASLLLVALSCNPPYHLFLPLFANIFLISNRSNLSVQPFPTFPKISRI